MRFHTAHYSIFGLNPGKNLLAIKEVLFWFGFRCFRFWVPAYWLWAAAAALFPGYCVITWALILFDASSAIQRLTSLGHLVIFGLLENGLRRWILERQEYGLANVVAGRGIDSAARQFLDSDLKKMVGVST
jgi:hypothetical protein